MDWLKGKKTIIGGILLSLIAVVWGIDQLIPGEWFAREQYEAAAVFIAGLTDVSMRLGIKKGK